MHGIGWLGVVLVVAWVVLWLGFKIVSGVVHILVLLGLAMLVWALVKRGARAVSGRG